MSSRWTVRQSHVAAVRRAAFGRLQTLYADRFKNSLDLTDDTRRSISDLEFTANYRTPFQFRSFVQRALKVGAFMQHSDGVMLTDLDGNRFYGLTGSYGVNVFGYDFYKECIDRDSDRVRDLGPVLGTYHPSSPTIPSDCA